MSQAEQSGRVDYIEFGTGDIEGSRRFFHEAFGWTFTDYGPEYTSFEDGRLTGGFRSDRPAGSAPLVVIYAADLDAMRQKVQAAGVAPFNDHSFPGGRRFHFTEPGGNELAVWSEK